MTNGESTNGSITIDVSKSSSHVFIPNKDIVLYEHKCSGCESACNCPFPKACIECSACAERKEFEAGIDANVRW